jgi:thymidylate synthase
MIKHYFEADSVDDLYLQLIEAISTEPQYQNAPRGMQIKETTGVVARLTDPSKCLITLKGRKLNYAFAAVEKLQYLTGNTEPDCLIHYNTNFGSYKNDYGFFDGAYPERLAYWYRHIYELLKADHDTRQAVMTIYGPQDRHKSKDIPCTVMFHFMIRDNKLNMISYMRSNDLLWGFPYDTNGFCFIQQALAAMLGVEVGYYELHAGSLHIYTEREEQLTSLLQNIETVERTPVAIPQYASFDAMQNDLRLFWIAERARRVDNITHEIVESLPAWLRYYYDEVDAYITKKQQKQLFTCN